MARVRARAPRRGYARARHLGLGAAAAAAAAVAAVVPSRLLPRSRARRLCYRAAQTEVVAEAAEAATMEEKQAGGEEEEEEKGEAEVEAEAGRGGCCGLMCCSARTVAAHACVTRCASRTRRR